MFSWRKNVSNIFYLFICLSYGKANSDMLPFICTVSRGWKVNPKGWVHPRNRNCFLKLKIWICKTRTRQERIGYGIYDAKNVPPHRELTTQAHWWLKFPPKIHQLFNSNFLPLRIYVFLWLYPYSIPCLRIAYRGSRVELLCALFSVQKNFPVYNPHNYCCISYMELQFTILFILLWKLLHSITKLILFIN